MSQTAARLENDKPYCGMAIASLVLGVLCFLIWPLTTIPAVICGHMGLSRIKKKPDRYHPSSKGMAIAGLATGYLYITILFLVLTLAAYLMIVKGIH